MIYESNLALADKHLDNPSRQNIYNLMKIGHEQYQIAIKLNRQNFTITRKFLFNTKVLSASTLN